MASLVNPEHLVGFIEAVASDLDIAFAYVHSLAELPDTEPASEVRRVLELGVTSTDLRKGIPTLCWHTVLGREYLELLGSVSDSTLSPGVSARVQKDRLSVHFEMGLDEVVSAPTVFEERAKRAREALGESLFWGQDGSRALVVPLFPVEA
jgi:hypothetical protein